jgi:hypothetical protein
MLAGSSGAYLSELEKFLWRSAVLCDSRHLRRKCRCGRGVGCYGMVVGAGQCEACSEYLEYRSLGYRFECRRRR